MCNPLSYISYYFDSLYEVDKNFPVNVNIGPVIVHNWKEHIASPIRTENRVYQLKSNSIAESKNLSTRNG